MFALGAENTEAPGQWSPSRIQLSSRDRGDYRDLYLLLGMPLTQRTEPLCGVAGTIGPKYNDAAARILCLQRIALCFFQRVFDEKKSKTFV